jgi:hypothetical protein
MLVGHSLPWHLSKSIRVETLCLNLISNQNMNNSKAKKRHCDYRRDSPCRQRALFLNRVAPYSCFLHIAEMLVQLERNPHPKPKHRTPRVDQGVMRVAMGPVWVTKSLREVDQASQIPVLFWVSGVHFCKGIGICFPTPTSVVPTVD